MGTRADFYVGRGSEAEWLGSIAWDGCPSGLESESLLNATTEEEFRSAVAKFSKEREDWTAPEMGWPWPWENSQTTDYAYAFDGRVWGSFFGHAWFPANEPEPDDDDLGDDAKPTVFPDMSAKKKATWGKRSGLIIL